MSFNVNEIKSWAKIRGATVKKKDDGYVWFFEGEEPSEAAPIDEVAKAIFNRVTEGRWVAYQKSVGQDTI